MQMNAVALYPKIINEINALVEFIAKTVSELPPDILLHRAWWEFAKRAIAIESESDINIDDSIAYRMIDYIQSIIASVKPAENLRDEVTENEWIILREKVGKLFRIINMDYHIVKTAHAKADEPEHNDEVEEFYYKAQLYWCNVRGDRYQAHDIPYLKEMFLPHSEIILELFGITAQDFVFEFEKIWRSLTFGIIEVYDEMETFRKDTLHAVEEHLKTNTAQKNVELPELMKNIINENGWQKRQERILGRFFGFDLFDIKKITTLPSELIDELTWGQGEDTEFFAPGEFQGWPLRIWPVFKRPLIRLNGRIFCFDLQGIFDNIYRVMQRIILRLKPAYKDTWNLIQQKQSEDLPLKYFRKLLPNSIIYHSVYYKWHADHLQNNKKWCEADGLVIYDDYLFIVESKAGAFTYTSPADDFPAYIQSIENLVLKPTNQGKRFLDYLSSEEAVSIFNKDHKKIGELRKSNFRQIIICPVTLDPFTEIAAQVQHLHKIGVDVGSHPIWAMSIDDLRVYADVFDNPLFFLHYVDQRILSFKSEIIQADDEFDHLGLYFEHNNYSQYALELQESTNAEINFTGYRTEIDKFFLERLYNPTAPCPLKQDMPIRISEIIVYLSKCNKFGRAKLSAYILDLDGTTRKQISDSIEQELLAQPTNLRPKPISAHGGIAFTIFCYRNPYVQRYAQHALDHANVVQLINSDRERLLIELSYSNKLVLTDIHWQWVELAAIPGSRLPKLQHDAEELRKRRVNNARAQHPKIGRNDSCPCGSGRKYKKCCLNKE
jgi:hypothetical protein